ncbi:succinylglutamate desuccinylase/aspartoacylase family protein [Candidatus Uhrbacteria bacterium]|nr:succinylglutamate desuccinylase/aspartoacylase family protein [Candidatus Uhrbacteria bacterium]
MNELAESIWEIKGNKAGKTLTIVGGTHGNERTGVEVVLRLKAMVESGALQIKRGTLYLILGNPRAIEINTRGSEPFHDLNRSYPTDLLRREPDGTYENARARLIAPLLQKSDVVIDLHSTNKPSEPFLACLHSARHEEVYKWFACDKILADPNFVLGGKSVTTDEYTVAYGGIGICYETGQASDTRRVLAVAQGVLGVMQDLQIIAHKHKPVPLCERETYELVESILPTTANFRFAEGYGNHSWEPFYVGDVIGYDGDQPRKVSYDGMLVFPKEEGKVMGYLAKRVEADTQP